MIAPARPANEPFRLAALHALPLLDTPPEADFEAVVQLGRALFAVETCLVTLVDGDRQWFKARAGLAATETPRDISFCGHAILQDEVFVVPDARQDIRFLDNPLVTQPPFIRFYAGAPILLPNGYTIGTVCIFDPQPRDGLGQADKALLRNLAELALTAIGMRALRDTLDQTTAEAIRLRMVLTALSQPVALLNSEGRLSLANDSFALFCVEPPIAGMDITQLLGIDTAIWSPASMRESGSHAAEIPPAAGRPALSVWRDAEGFVLLAQ